jgi:glycosyltransferase involved in cell wall biosynthesis
MEAAACGTPVIAPKAAGFAEVMTDGREGFLLDDPMDVGELTAILKRFVEHPERWPELGADARRLALQWDWDSVWNRTSALYSEITERKRVLAG